MKKISVVVPTIRPTCLERFLQEWNSLFRKHQIDLFIIWDGEKQIVENKIYNATGVRMTNIFDVEDILPEKKNRDLICNFSTSCKNLGLAAVAVTAPDTDIVIVLDDDCYPSRTEKYYDAIAQHAEILDARGPLRWTQSAIPLMRGFPYIVRREVPVMFSHGLWEHNADHDAVSSIMLADAEKKLTLAFSPGSISQGIYMPICGMNIAFNIDALPYVYFAPVADVPGCERFDDIWMGIWLMRAFWKKGWLVHNGAAIIHHDRASNVWKNLRQEAVGLEINETYWREDFKLPHHLSYLQEWFDSYDSKRDRWEVLIADTLRG